MEIWYSVVRRFVYIDIDGCNNWSDKIKWLKDYSIIEIKLMIIILLW